MDKSILRIRKKFPNKLPCVVEFEGNRLKFIVPKDLSVSELMVHIRNQIEAKKLCDKSRSSAFFLMRGATMMQGTMTMQEAVGGDHDARMGQHGSIFAPIVRCVVDQQRLEELDAEGAHGECCPTTDAVKSPFCLHAFDHVHESLNAAALCIKQLAI